jgi:xylulokinase
VWRGEKAVGDLLIGLDIGTTNIKAAAFAADGRPVAAASVQTPTTRLPDGGAEYDPEAVWQGAATVLSQVVQALGAQTVRAVGICSMAEAGSFVDEAGRPLGPAISWFDLRTRPQAERLRQEIGDQELFRVTGQSIQTKWSLLKMLWWRENRPDLFHRASRWLCMMDWIIYRLTGEQVTDPSLACRTLALDMRQGTTVWATDLLARVGVPASLMPRIIPSGAVAGTVLPGPAAETGLPAGTPVVTGGHDHPVASLAAGVTGPGTMLDSTGTAEAVIGATPAPRLDQEALASGITNSPLPPPGLFGLQGGLNASGGSLEWFKRQFAPDLEYGDLVELARSAGDGPTGIVFLPHLAGAGAPQVDPASRGAFAGLHYGTGRAQLVKAVLEGTVCEVRMMVDAMVRLTGRPFETVIVTGGHTRNPVWMQLRADIFGRPVIPSTVEDATLLGCALLAGTATGLYRDLREAVALAGGRTGEPILPRPGLTERYGAWFTEVYSRVHAQLAPVHQAIDNMART